MNDKLKRKWQVNNYGVDDEVTSLLACELGCSNALAHLLVSRGYDNYESAYNFIKKSQEILHNPFLLDDMEKAVNRILLAVNNDETITIYGDYDVDGVTSVSILYLYLESLGANVNYYIPCRKSEGYGVSVEALEKLRAKGTKLVITVDTGVTAIKEAEYAKKCGIDMVITDHHECTDALPNAVAVVNPKRHNSTYPFSALAGVGVVFKLLCAIEKTANNLSIMEATKRIANNFLIISAS